MRRLALPLVLLLMSSFAVSASAETSQTQERRYQFALGGPGCSAFSDGSGEGNGAGCFMLDGSAFRARITLADDTFGAMRSEWYLDAGDGTVRTGTFCGSTEFDVSAGSTFLAVWVSGTLVPEPDCPHSHGFYTDGTVTLERV